MNKIDTLKEIEKYLIKKKFEFEIDNRGDDYILFSYNFNYSKFTIKIYLIKDYNDKLTVKYYSNCEVLNIKRLRNSTSSKNYLRSIYDNLNYIRLELKRKSISEKEKIDNNKKYCTELESHYKKIHNIVNVDVSLSKVGNPSDSLVSITIKGYDNNKITTYNIFILDNKYYLNSLEEKYSPNIKI